MSKNCSACNDLRKSSPEFTQKGVTETVCTSLKNNTGFNPSNDTEDFDDLYDAVDCLVCNMDDELPAYDVCDWKEFMKKLIPNLCNTLKAIVCAIGGIWTKITDMYNTLRRLQCIVEYLTKDQKIHVGIDHIKFFNGVQPRQSGDNIVEPQMNGNAYCAYMTGSLSLGDDWESRFPNSDMNHNGILLYEYRIKLNDFNLKKVYNGNMQENANGKCIHAHVFKFTHSDKADEQPYGPGNTGYASYAVPEGWVYLQVRMSSYDTTGNGDVTLSGVVPILMDSNSFDCD